MSDTLSDPAPPPGFERHDRPSPVTDAWEPLFSRKTDSAVVIGLRIAERHCNSRGFAHGGLITALADNAMGLSCKRVLKGPGGLVTVNLSIDFLRSANVGQWLEIDTTFIKPGRALCFAQAFITADGEPCARANAVFRVV